jgi:hypothetical protein
MTLLTIHGEPVRDIRTARIVSNAEARRRVETLRLNQNRLRRLFGDHMVSLACDCHRLADHEYQPEDYEPR